MGQARGGCNSNSNYVVLVYEQQWLQAQLRRNSTQVDLATCRLCTKSHCLAAWSVLVFRTVGGGGCVALSTGMRPPVGGADGVVFYAAVPMLHAPCYVFLLILQLVPCPNICSYNKWSQMPRS